MVNLPQSHPTHKEILSALEKIESNKKAFESKKILQRIYNYYFSLIKEEMAFPFEKTVEIGGGAAFFKRFLPAIQSADIVESNYVDLVCDGHQLPFKTASLSNVILIDVFHHLQFPQYFLTEAHRVLQIGGKLILLEPFVSPLSYLIYKYFHEESFSFKENPFISESFNQTKKPSTSTAPYTGNQAISRILWKTTSKHHNRLMGFSFRYRFLDIFAYPATGGLSRPQLLGDSLLSKIHSIETSLTEKLPLSFLTFRILIIAEKNVQSQPQPAPSSL